MATRSAHPGCPGLLLSRGDVVTASSWVRRGVVPARVRDLGEWTAITPVGPRGLAAMPYDRSLQVLAARPMGYRMRPGTGFFIIDDRAVLTVQSPRWRAVHRWLVWQPGVGVVRSTLPTARPGDLLAICGNGTAPHRDDLVSALQARPASALAWLEGVRSVLGLPGDGILTDPGADRGEVVEPTPAQVARFHEAVNRKGPQ